MPHIKVISHEESEGRLREIYDNLIETRGKLATVHQIQSLNPESIVHHMELYMHLLYGKSPVKRYQREMIAVVVSISNKCEYCTIHHAEALNHYWKDDVKIEQLKADFTKLELKEVDLIYCDLAKCLTLTPSSEKNEKYIKALKILGISEKAILDATMIIAYFNYVNRIILGLGVHIESDGGKGYVYE